VSLKPSIAALERATAEFIAARREVFAVLDREQIDVGHLLDLLEACNENTRTAIDALDALDLVDLRKQRGREYLLGRMRRSLRGVGLMIDLLSEETAL
jgi:hypothetical protein